MNATNSNRLPDEWVEKAKQADVLRLALEYGATLTPGARSPNSREHYGPCPACGGTDRFSVNTHKNVFNCRVGGKAGNAIQLAMYEALQTIKPYQMAIVINFAGLGDTWVSELLLNGGG